MFFDRITGIDGPDADAKVNFDATDARTGPAMGSGAGGAVPIFGWHYGSHPSAYAFTGRTYDPESSLHQYRHRYYDSGLGRFLSRDPLGPEVVLRRERSALYGFLRGNPIVYIDPYGLMSEQEWDKCCKGEHADQQRAALTEAARQVDGLPYDDLDKA